MGVYEGRVKTSGGAGNNNYSGSDFSVSGSWGSITVLDVASHCPPPLPVFKRPTPQHTQQTRGLFIESAKAPSSPGYANTKFNQVAIAFSPLLKYDRKKKWSITRKLIPRAHFQWGGCLCV